MKELPTTQDCRKPKIKSTRLLDLNRLVQSLRKSPRARRMLSGAEAVNAKGVVASEAAPNSTPVMVPRTVSGKWATDASVQLSREFEDWLAERPAPARDDEEGDETYATFMKQRRLQQDADRWRSDGSSSGQRVARKLLCSRRTSRSSASSGIGARHAASSAMPAAAPTSSWIASESESAPHKRQ